tara:strand:- start:6791 stop:7783 length:993 start_codon:yes stop_codon:yes gene_type:complete
MIISRTPFRISFVGGGTDIKSFYYTQPGQVLSTSINKFLYVIVKKQIGIVSHKFKINWKNVDLADKIEDIKNPIVREILKYFNIDFPIEITSISDLPSNSGLGSSSSFAVGLIKAISALQNINLSKYETASIAADIEINKLNRSIGKQDHFAASYGNLNIFKFYSNEKVEIEPIYYKETIKKKLEKNILLFWTNIQRDANNVLKSQNKNAKINYNTLVKMKNYVEPMRDILTGKSKLLNFGKILNDSWQLKKSLETSISSKIINNYYSKAIKSGASGGKLLGAGGGGFLLFYVEPKYQQSVIKTLKELQYFKFEFDSSGSRITYYDSDKY